MQQGKFCCRWTFPQVLQLEKVNTKSQLPAAGSWHVGTQTKRRARAFSAKAIRLATEAFFMAVLASHMATMKKGKHSPQRINDKTEGATAASLFNGAGTGAGFSWPRQTAKLRVPLFIAFRRPTHVSFLHSCPQLVEAQGGEDTISSQIELPQWKANASQLSGVNAGGSTHTASKCVCVCHSKVLGMTKLPPCLLSNLGQRLQAWRAQAAPMLLSQPARPMVLTKVSSPKAALLLR